MPQARRPGRLVRADSQVRHREWPGALAYVALTFAWSWSFFALAMLLGGEWPEPRALAPWAIGAVAPALVAFVLTYRVAGRAGARSLLRSTLAFRRIGARWWAVVAVLAALPNAAAVALLTAATGELPESVREADPTLLSAPGVLVFAFLAGLAEEPGWRGYALERLRSRPLLTASLLVGVAWSAWHLPYFFIDGTFQHDLGLGAWLAWFLLQILPNAVIIAWVYVRTGRLVVAALALHALGNAAGELISVDGGGRWLSLAVLTVLALAVVVRDRQLFFGVRAGDLGTPDPVARARGAA